MGGAGVVDYLEEMGREGKGGGSEKKKKMKRPDIRETTRGFLQFEIRITD